MSSGLSSMPPKGSTAGKAKGKAVAQSSQEVAVPPVPVAAVAVPQPGGTSKIMLEIDEAMKLIANHPDLNDIAGQPPLGLGQGGASATFKINDLKQALGGNHASGAEYVCTCNFAWCDTKYTNSPGVPLLHSSIQEYADQLYSDTNNLPIARITVGITSAKPLPTSVFSPGGSAPTAGSVTAMSPQEDIVAPYLAIYKALKKGEMAESDVKAWRKFFATALFTWKVLPTNEDMEFETITIRQRAALTHQTISYTPVQWVCKIVQMKKERETVGNKVSSGDLAAAFKKRNFKPARGQEDISATFIDNALYVWSKALCYPEVGPYQRLNKYNNKSLQEPPR